MMSPLPQHDKETHDGSGNFGQLAPVAHLPLVLGVLRKLEVAALIDTLIPPHPVHVVSCGRGVEALVMAILDGHHALYTVGRRLDERGMFPLVQPGLQPSSLHDTRLGQMLAALVKANLNQVLSPEALRALETSVVETPWMHQDTTTITRYGAYAASSDDPRAPRPPSGQSKDGRGDLKQVLLSLGVSGDGGLPLRLGLRDGKTNASVDVPKPLQRVWRAVSMGSKALWRIVKPIARGPWAYVWSTRSAW